MIQQESHATPRGIEHTITSTSGGFASALFEVASLSGHEVEPEVLHDGRHRLTFACSDEEELSRLYRAAHLLEAVRESQERAQVLGRVQQ